MRVKFYANKCVQVAEVINAIEYKEKEAHLFLANGKMIIVKRCDASELINQLYEIGYIDIVVSCLGNWSEYVDISKN